jgi:predicted PurR-regulated permease PerM
LPLLAAGVAAAVASPLVSRLDRRMPRGAAALLLLLGLVALGALLVVVIVAGISTQRADLSRQLSGAKEALAGWLTDLGVDIEEHPSAFEPAGEMVGGGPFDAPAELTERGR